MSLLLFVTLDNLFATGLLVNSMLLVLSCCCISSLVSGLQAFLKMQRASCQGREESDWLDQAQLVDSCIFNQHGTIFPFTHTSLTRIKAVEEIKVLYYNRMNYCKVIKFIHLSQYFKENYKKHTIFKRWTILYVYAHAARTLITMKYVTFELVIKYSYSFHLL